MDTRFPLCEGCCVKNPSTGRRDEWSERGARGGCLFQSPIAEHNVYRHSRCFPLPSSWSRTFLVRAFLSSFISSHSAYTPFPLTAPKYFPFPKQFTYLCPWTLLMLTPFGSSGYLSGELPLLLQNRTPVCPHYDFGGHPSSLPPLWMDWTVPLSGLPRTGCLSSRVGLIIWRDRYLLKVWLSH